MWSVCVWFLNWTIIPVDLLDYTNDFDFLSFAQWYLVCSPVIGDEVEVDPGHVGPHHLQTLTGELWVGLLVRLQDLVPGLHQVGDALLPHGVFD